uniref:Uncharacterized protein n=1 Tax=viral metagenome TaxID=1070528 RepID=A0A6C0KSK0_9ZZZZ
MGVFDMLKGGSGGPEGYTPATGLGSDITAGGRRRRKSLRRKGARKGTHKRARKHYGGYSQQKHQQGGDRLAELEEKEAARTLTDEEEITELKQLRRRKVLEEKEAAGTLTDEGEITELKQLRRRKVLEEKEAAGTLTDEGEITELKQLRNPTGGGGSRRRKSRHSKKSHSKKTRGKKTSAWIKHVLQFAKDNKMKYFQALKDKRCRATYKSSK